MNKGLTHVYTGDGKGKTTAAMGLCLRAAGNGLTVKIYQFCKTSPSGEVKAFERFDNVKLRRADTDIHKFVWDMTDDEKERYFLAQQALFDEACEDVQDMQNDVVLLDEALGAVNVGALQLSELIYLMDHKAKSVELIITGRSAPEKLTDKADYVTEMRAVRHPYTQGISARRGVEY